MVRLVASLAALLCFAASIWAQGIPSRELSFETGPYKPAPSVRVESNVVWINVIVRDGEGRAVAGLKREDFKVYDQGKLQSVSEFAIERATGRASARESPSKSPSPPRPQAAKTPSRFIALFFDDRSTPFKYLDLARNAAKEFVREDLHPGDQAGVFTSSGITSQSFTDNVPRLLKAIEAINVDPLGRPSSFHPCTEYAMGPYAAYLILDVGDSQALHLYMCQGPKLPGNIEPQPVPLFTPPTEQDVDTEAHQILSATEVIAKFSLGSLDSVIARLARKQGSRLVVLTSSGFFTASVQPEVDEVTNDALSAGVVIDSLDAKGLVARTPGGGAITSPIYSIPETEYERQIIRKQRQLMSDVMVSLSRDTGGMFFHNNNDLLGGLGELAALPPVSYRLGFSPENLKFDGRFHALKVKLAVPGSFQIQARKGYFAPTRAAGRDEARASAFEAEVLQANSVNGVPVEIRDQPGRLAAGGTGLQISLRIDPRSLSFRKSAGRHVDQLSLVVALFSGRQKFVVGEKGMVNMALKNAAWKELHERGITPSIVLEAPEGNYNLRVVLEDQGSGKMFAVTRQASIP